MNYNNIFSEYLRKEEHKNPKTILAYQQAVNEFQHWYTQTTGQAFDVQNITPLDIKDYISWLTTIQKQAPATINKKIGGLKSFFGFLSSQKIIVTNPIANIKSKKISTLQQIPRWLTRSEQSRLLHEISKTKNNLKRTRDHAIAQLMLQAGLRVFEVAALNIDDIDFRRNTVVIREGKGGKMAILPLNKDAINALTDYLKYRQADDDALFRSKIGSRLTDRGIQHQFRKYFDCINLPDATVHSLRHSFCKNLLDKETPLTVVAQLARHEKLETTKIYLTPSKHDLQKAVQRINSN